MVEPRSHCPYVGLKQNRAVRFATPTPEHRCYITGEPIEIPVDQAQYCLAPGHIHCPLYTGSDLTTTGEALAAAEYGTSTGGVRGWLASLSPRDRAVYLLMLLMLLLITLIYVIAGWRSLSPVDSTGDHLTPSMAAVTLEPSRAPVVSAASATRVLPTPTDLPTGTPRQIPTETPTQPLIFSPTQVGSATRQPTPANATSVPATATRTPGTAANATAQPATETATTTSAPSATTTPTLNPNTPTELVTLYFGDATGTLLVPVQQRVPVENGQLAAAAVRALVAEPPNGLQRVIPAGTQLRNLTLTDDTVIANFNRRPSAAGDDRGLRAIVQTLVELPGIALVQFQVNGQDIGIAGTGPDGWAPINVLNPQNLPVDVQQTTFLPLYFVSADGAYDVRILRLVPPTKQTATATIRALIEGPGPYAGAVQQVIPPDTELRAITLANGIVTLNFSSAFTNAPDRNAAVRTIVESLTTLPTVQAVRFFVEGQSLGEVWGPEYGQTFARPVINVQ